VLEGVRVLYRLLLNRMAAEGISQFKSMGKNFNPILHEAIGTAPGAEMLPSGCVIDELRPGYQWQDEVLRPARVVVSE
jgi:molecular chaperone GrpE